MIPVTEKLLKDVADAVVRTADPLQVYVFGSHARGNPRPESDLDLLVIVDRPLGQGAKRLDEIRALRRALARFRVAKDVLVYDSSELENWKDSRNHVIGRCVREGRLLYARPQTH